MGIRFWLCCAGRGRGGGGSCTLGLSKVMTVLTSIIWFTLNKRFPRIIPLNGITQIWLIGLEISSANFDAMSDDVAIWLLSWRALRSKLTIANHQSLNFQMNNNVKKKKKHQYSHFLQISVWQRFSGELGRCNWREEDFYSQQEAPWAFHSCICCCLKHCWDLCCCQLTRVQSGIKIP